MRLTPSPLEDEFLRLEPLTEDHRAPLRPLADDPSLWVQTTLNASGDGFDRWFDTMMESHRSGQQVSFAVFDKRVGVFVGHTSYLSISADHQRVEIGWTWYGTAYHRSHVNPAAKRLLLANAFDQGAYRVELKTGDQNLRSQGAMTKMGATREGVLRSHSRTWARERRDSVFFSILAPEWPGVKAGLDARLSEA